LARAIAYVLAVIRDETLPCRALEVVVLAACRSMATGQRAASR
jgi:hypothetical protein